jgi:hypothetical protein
VKWCKPIKPVNQAPVLKNRLVPFFLLPCFFLSNLQKKEARTNTTKWRRKKNQKKGETQDCEWKHQK